MMPLTGWDVAMVTTSQVIEQHRALSLCPLVRKRPQCFCTVVSPDGCCLSLSLEDLHHLPTKFSTMPGNVTSVLAWASRVPKSNTALNDLI